MLNFHHVYTVAYGSIQTMCQILGLRRIGSKPPAPHPFPSPYPVLAVSIPLVTRG